MPSTLSHVRHMHQLQEVNSNRVLTLTIVGLELVSMGDKASANKESPKEAEAKFSAHFAASSG